MNSYQVITDIKLLTEALALNSLFNTRKELNDALDEALERVDLDPCGFNMDKFLASPAGIIPMEFRAKERQDSLGLPTNTEFELLVNRLEELEEEERARYMQEHEERDYDPFHDDPDQDPFSYRGEL